MAPPGRGLPRPGFPGAGLPGAGNGNGMPGNGVPGLGPPGVGTPGNGTGTPGVGLTRPGGTGKKIGPGPALLPFAVNTTSWLIDGVVGENVKFAEFAGSVPDAVMVRDDVDVCRLSLVTT